MAPHEMQNKCAEIKIRAERRAGELLKEGQEKGEILTQDSGRPQKVLHDAIHNNQPKTLRELGIEPTQSHRFQTLADMPEEEFCFTFLKGTIYKASRLYPLIFL